MGTKSVQLQSETSPEWIKVVLNDFDAFLVDHASCERKANALLMLLHPISAVTPIKWDAILTAVYRYYPLFILLLVSVLLV